MLFVHFLSFSLFILSVSPPLIEARGAGGGRVSGRISVWGSGFGGGGLYSGWSKKSRRSSSSSFSFAPSSNGEATTKRRHYSPSISRRFNGYRPMSNPRYSSYPFHQDRDDENNLDYRHRFKSLDNDVNAGFASGFAAGFSTTQMLSNLMQLKNMPLIESVEEEISTESLEKAAMNNDDDNREFNISERDTHHPLQQKAYIADTVVNESLKPVLKIMKQKEPGNIFNVPDEFF